MPRTPALSTVCKRFGGAIQSAADLYSAVRPFSEGTWDSINGWEPIYPGQARRIVSLAFLQIVIGWEDFVEATFIRYLAGAMSPSAYTPVLRLGTAKSLSHAYQLATGEPGYDPQKHFGKWNNWKDIEELAKVFFDSGRPFTNLTQHEKQRLSAAIYIRNRVAHSSSKCRSDFVRVSKEHLGISTKSALPQGFSVGHLLLTSSKRLFGPNAEEKPYFEHYLDVFESAAKRICPL